MFSSEVHSVLLEETEAEHANFHNLYISRLPSEMYKHVAAGSVAEQPWHGCQKESVFQC